MKKPSAILPRVFLIMFQTTLEKYLHVCYSMYDSNLGKKQF